MAAREGLAVQRDRSGDRNAPHAATAYHRGQCEGAKDGQPKPSAPNYLCCHHNCSIGLEADPPAAPARAAPAGAAGSFGYTLLPVTPQHAAAIGLARRKPGEE